MSGHPRWALLVCAVLLSGCQSTGSGRFPWLTAASHDEFSEDKLSSADELRPAFAANTSSAADETKSRTNAPAAAAGRIDQLVADAQRAVQRAGQAADKAQELNRAKELYREALKLDPRNASAHHGMAIVADLEENWGPAEFHYKQALAQMPRNASLLNDLGYSYLLQNRFHEASEYLNQAVQVEPAHEHARINLALLSLRRGDRDTAYSQLTQLLSPNEALQTIARLESDIHRNSAGANTAEIPDIPRHATFDEAMAIAAQVGRQERLDRQQRAMPPATPTQAIPSWPSAAAGQNVAQAGWPNASHPNAYAAGAGQPAMSGVMPQNSQPAYPPNGMPNAGAFNGAPLPMVSPAAMASSAPATPGGNIFPAGMSAPLSPNMPSPSLQTMPVAQHNGNNMHDPSQFGGNPYFPQGAPAAAAGRPAGGVLTLGGGPGGVQPVSYPEAQYPQPQYPQPQYPQPQYPQAQSAQPQPGAGQYPQSQHAQPGVAAANYGANYGTNGPEQQTQNQTYAPSVGLIQQVTPQHQSAGRPLNPRVSQAPMTGLNAGPDALFPIGQSPGFPQGSAPGSNSSQSGYYGQPAQGTPPYGVPQPQAGAAYHSSAGAHTALNGAMFPQAQSYLPTQQQFDQASRQHQNMSASQPGAGMYPGGYPAPGQQPNFGANPTNSPPYSPAAYGQPSSGQNAGLPVSPASYGSTPSQPSVAAPNPLAAYEQQLRDHDNEYNRVLQQINNPQAAMNAVPAQY